DARIYGDFADGLKTDYPATAKILSEMMAEEDGHRHRLIELYQQKFGDHIPLIRRQDVKGFVTRTPIWLVRPLGLIAVRKQIELMELETQRSIRRPHNKPRTRASGNFSATSRPRSGDTRFWRSNSKAPSAPQGHLKMKPQRESACSYCRSSN